ncbi:MAG: ferrous iron transport protein B [Prevotellaceae bacterium]|jgi:ferrous iron transport protein B|nr:ferrous iron transport protein B [Prevotellaceae bacterium]
MKHLSAANSHKLDIALTHRGWGLVIFLVLMWLMFYCTFTLGAYPQEWIQNGVSALSRYIVRTVPEGMLKDLLVDGVINGVGSVVVFIPNILILFLFIAFFEESGYMQRAARLMDRYMNRVGLHGQSFLPLVMAFGCNVPAILSTQTISDRRYRLITILINPFMSCSARLPVYILMIAAFFPEHSVTVFVFIYIFGITTAIITALIIRRFIAPVQSNKVKVKYQLSPYRLPSIRSTMNFMWEKALQYLKKISSVVLVAVIIIWALNYFPRQTAHSLDYETQISQIKQKHQDGLISKTQMAAEIRQTELAKQSEHQQNSYLGRIGRFVEPAMRPLGFDWKMSIALLSGFPAKEFIVGSLGVLYQIEKADEHSSALIDRLNNERYTQGLRAGEKVFDKAVALAFLIFVLLYFPCVASIAAIRKETGGWKWALFAVTYTTALAWILSFTVYRIASIFL